MKIILEISRFNPKTDEGPCFRKYEVEAEPNDRLLDVLMHFKRTVDPFDCGCHQRYRNNADDNSQRGEK